MGFGDGGLPSHGALIRGRLRRGAISGERGEGRVHRAPGGATIQISVAASAYRRVSVGCIGTEVAARSTEIRWMITEHYAVIFITLTP